MKIGHLAGSELQYSIRFQDSVYFFQSSSWFSEMFNCIPHNYRIKFIIPGLQVKNIPSSNIQRKIVSCVVGRPIRKFDPSTLPTSGAKLFQEQTGSTSNFQNFFAQIMLFDHYFQFIYSL